MYEVTFSIDGVIEKIVIPANSYVEAFTAITNMYSNSKTQIINIRKI